MWRIDWKGIKTLTINNCDPTSCKFERCPMHAGNDNPFPVKDEAQPEGPGVLVLSCNQNPLLAKALIAFASKLQKKKGGQHGAVVEHVGGE